MGTFKGKRKKRLFLSTNVKPRYHMIKSPCKSPAKRKIRPKENDSPMNFGNIKSPVLKLKRGAPSPCKHTVFSPLRKKQRTAQSPCAYKFVASSTPKKSKRRILDDHCYRALLNNREVEKSYVYMLGCVNL